MTRRTHLLIRSLSLLVAFALVGAACTTSDDDASPDAAVPDGIRHGPGKEGLGRKE